ATLAIALLVLLMAPERREAVPTALRQSLWQQIADYLTILRSPVFWRIAPIAGLLPAAMVAYQGLWAGRWLADIAGAGPALVARHLLWLALAVVAGYVLCGVFVDRLKACGIDPLKGLAAAAAVAIACQALLAVGVIGLALPLWGV